MPFDSMQFRYPWRPYQKRVLDAIDDHLDDQRLHVVAAPGAGKTTLGLESFRLLRKSALVLSPTRVIRDQWIDRLGDFCVADDVTVLDWVSKSLDDPKVLTSITYQALHAKVAGDLRAEEEDEIVLEESDGIAETELDSLVKTLKDHNIQVLILDEAHHLRSEWWRALDKVCTLVPDMTLVSLTATPPYDTQSHEWLKYEQLCGPVDEEISVPELVKSGTLCAHQDYIWAADAAATEKQSIKEYDDRVSSVCDALFDNAHFVDIVMSHHCLRDAPVEQEVIKHPEIAMAVLCFLKARHSSIPKALLTLLDLTPEDIPELGRHWWQVLVAAVLFSVTFKLSEAQQEFVERLKKQLRSSELLHKRELSLERSRRLERKLSLSPSKIKACGSIHKLEYRHRGEGLRQVVLTDYIRDETLRSEIDAGEVNLGAWPVFKGISSSSPIPDQIGLLTGRLSIVPAGQLENLLEYVDRDRITTAPMGNLGQYRKVTGPLNQLTAAFTALLVAGHIKTLVGTRALLGEGWDAPAINSLILASSVGSFMLTNQMRGRAIRVDRDVPGKLSAIWHLVAVNTKSTTGWSDCGNLEKRFATFVGLSERDNTIESGFERMDATALEFGSRFNGISPVTANNRQMLRRYRKLHTIADRWKSALTVDESANVSPAVMIPKVPGLRGFHIKHTLRYLLMQMGTVIAALIAQALHARPQGGSGLILAVLIILVAALLYKLPQTFTVLKIFFRHLPVDGSIKQVGKALADALCRTGLLETPLRQLKVNVTRQTDGSFYLSLAGGTFYESSLFADCMAEILGPIDNPRYLIVREGIFLGITRDDYHALPMKLAARKDFAQIFYSAWCKYVGPTELIYTRTQAGRSQLLKAKMRAFSSTFEREVKRQDRWQAK